VLARIATTCFRRRRLVLLAWVAVVVTAVLAAGSLAGAWADDARLSGTDSQAAYDLLEDEMPSRAGETGAVVFEAPAGIDAAPARAAIERYLADVADVDGIAGVTSPFDDPELISADGRIAIAQLDFDADADDDETAAAASAVRERAGPLEAAGVDAAFGGWLFSEFEMPASELVGFLAAVVILLVAFGSVVAMGLPLVSAVAGIVVSLAGIGVTAALVDTPEFTVQVASMIGIGVGIDYALFIVTRYRAALARGAAPIDATAEAVGTAGRAVVFAGCTVMISLLGLLLIGIPFLYGLAIGTSLAVAVAVVAAITLLPAMLGVVGTNIDRLSVHRRRRRADTRTRETVAHRWARGVQRRPGVAAVAGGGVLLLMAAPVLGMRLASADAGNEPEGTTTRIAYDRIADGFGPGVNGPLLVVLRTPTDASRDAVPGVVDAVAATDGVALVTGPISSPTGEIAVLQVIPTTSPQSEATTELVNDLRDDVLPAATAGAAGLEAHVGGQTASDVDFASVMSARLPWFIGAVLVVSFLLLLAVFRSVLVPLKAVVMNLLSIGAAYGLIVALFQWGWFGSVLGLSAAPIEPWAPMMLFAIVFGMSMDYEVFLLSSVREEYDRTGDNETAVVEGLASSARVITAAAAIMVCVFASFAVADVRQVKLMGIGLAAAVLIDATLVRMVLVPATMQLLGDRNWWFPRWLDRIVPRIHVEAPPLAAPPVVATMDVACAHSWASRPSPEPGTLPPPQPVTAGAGDRR
jgi:putative drug exporter of the RND superfamily